MHTRDSMTITELLAQHPYVNDFFDSYGLQLPAEDSRTLVQYLDSIDEERWEDLGASAESVLENFEAFLQGMADLASEQSFSVESLTVIGGQNKRGEPEEVTLELRRGDIVSIVGPTGSGKSRLLGDIEWMACGDTPTKRRVLVNGQQPDASWRFSIERKLVAQLSQNMNFVMDLSVKEFVDMHAESRLTANRDEVTATIIREANSLAGEPFEADTPITSLSGGQSRALMIADTAFLSRSPIILIDEIENAGIDRQRALDLLVREEKIVLIATHDPILALMAPRRIVIRNGGIAAVLQTSVQEQDNLKHLQELDRKVLALRNRIRTGGRIEDTPGQW
ncbi:ABC transporter ATP-binding protein [Desulfurispirillum indicum]|uniref:ATP-binding cassette domain-containing protein n=1 Tax=Desulfurispirillum indicum TaxID=936456 RepID=UPI001CF9EE7E|nr:ABC transporter ATP-binding protein [Desulfurispirillum indicum]UCZ56602.1 ABC transporter ATP-binding protein [Desulfurispirillum indicum]